MKKYYPSVEVLAANCCLVTLSSILFVQQVLPACFSQTRRRTLSEASRFSTMQLMEQSQVLTSLGRSLILDAQVFCQAVERELCRVAKTGASSTAVTICSSDAIELCR